MDLYNAIIAKNLVLNALVSSEQIRFKQTSETLCIDIRVPDEILGASSRRVNNRGYKISHCLTPFEIYGRARRDVRVIFFGPDLGRNL